METTYKATIDCPDCGEKADCEYMGSGYYEIDCPQCEYYEYVRPGEKENRNDNLPQ